MKYDPNIRTNLADISGFGRIGMNRWFAYLAVALSIFVFLSCSARPVASPMTGTMGNPSPVTDGKLAVGDEIEIKFAYSPEFNESQTIRPDGKIELLLIGEIDAAGKTPSQLRNELIERYRQHLAHPELAVLTRLSLHRRVFVGGAVNTPGIQQMPGDLTALEAIMQSGGFELSTAEIRNVIIIRPNGSGRDTYVLNFEDSLTGNGGNPFFLQPRDIVYVPRTRIAEVAQWVDQHIWKIIPLRFSTGYFWSND